MKLVSTKTPARTISTRPVVPSILSVKNRKAMTAATTNRRTRSVEPIFNCMILNVFDVKRLIVATKVGWGRAGVQPPLLHKKNFVSAEFDQAFVFHLFQKAGDDDASRAEFVGQLLVGDDDGF